MEVTLIVIAVTQIFLSIAIVFLSLTQKRHSQLDAKLVGDFSRAGVSDGF